MSPDVLGTIADDALSLARLVNGNVSIRSVIKTIVANDSFAILLLWRLRQFARRYHLVGVNSVLRRVQTAMYGIELGNNVTLGVGVYFVHTVGTVVGGNARIGDRVQFMGSNTVGTASNNGYPLIAEDVQLGAGARVLGPVRIGARAIVGANAVVIADVPTDSVAVGVPARVRRRRPQAQS